MAMIGSNPRIVRATAAAVIEEISSGTTVREVRSSIRISEHEDHARDRGL